MSNWFIETLALRRHPPSTSIPSAKTRVTFCGSDIDGVHLGGGALRVGVERWKLKQRCGRITGTFQIPLGGSLGGGLRRGQTGIGTNRCCWEECQKLANFNGAAAAARGDGMMHAGNACRLPKIIARDSCPDAYALSLFLRDRGAAVFFPKVITMVLPSLGEEEPNRPSPSDFPHANKTIS